MTRILFVCTANVQRSVLAERLLAARLPPGSALLPESAGTQAWHRSPLEDSVRAVLAEFGGDGSGFASRPLTARLVDDAALVLGLAREHREAAVRLAPSAMRRCFTLKEFVRLADGDGETGARGTRGFGAVLAAATARRGAVSPVPPAEDDIADPWSGSPRELRACALEIDRVVGRLVQLWT
ncbi:low molecular weight phosphatase family protein [Streptomyces sp. NPDC007901]|uniref:arsenate reductase/protein-tyrosine-phosphatase family protein n=1 Tax=Streptomyces sp. NPDC007901 TaxID=3364785 RepID=UPI0036ECF038